MSVSRKENRRNYKRYRTLKYTALVQRWIGLGQFGVRREAALINFNRNGALLCCEQSYKEGDRLRLTIQSANERISNIHALVRHVRQVKGECYIGLEFVEGKDFQRQLSGERKSILASMEEVINHQLA
ncbi:MAG: PilZ domain-containing protein [Pseudomonadales bacterium]